MNKLQELTLEVTVRECVGADPIDPDSYKEDVLEESSIIIGLDDRYKDTVYHNLLGLCRSTRTRGVIFIKDCFRRSYYRITAPIS